VVRANMLCWHEFVSESRRATVVTPGTVMNPILSSLIDGGRLLTCST